jgi:hypothetical protein
VKGELLVTYDDGMAGVVAALIPNDVVDATTKKVSRFPFAFVTPLGTDENDCWHGGEA